MGWRWEHLQPVFEHLRVDLVNSALIEGYKKQRHNEGDALATVQVDQPVYERMAVEAAKEGL